MEKIPSTDMKFLIGVKMINRPERISEQTFGAKSVQITSLPKIKRSKN